MQSRRLRRLMPVVPALVLVACTGGILSYNGGVGTGGTGFVQGAVTGFGSVVVDGTSLNSSSAQYREGNDTDEAGATNATAVKLGDRLQVQLDAQGNPSTVLIDPDLVGTLQQLGPSGTPGFVVNGVPVQINTDPSSGPVTFYAGLSGYGGLQAGMPVEVHGAYGVDANGQEFIRASLVEQLPSTNPVTRITGVISNLDAVAGHFQVGGNTVQLAANASVLPDRVSLSDGQVVNVWSNVPSSGGMLSAKVVRIHTLCDHPGAVQLGGVVSMLNGSQFELDGIAVDAADASLTQIVQSLSDGAYVVVDGVSDSASDTVRATSVRAYAASPSQVSLRGTISGFVDTSHFLVRGVPVDASGAQFQQGDSSQLADGAYVDVVGNVAAGSGNMVSASQVSILGTPSEGDTVDYRGSISQVDETRGTFTLTTQSNGAIQHYAVVLAPNAAYANGSSTQLTNGANVEVEATRSASGLTAFSIAFLPDGSSYPPSSLETEGIIYGVTATSFHINDLLIQTNGITPIGGPLVDGAAADVYFTQSGGSNIAQQILIEQ